MAVTPQLHQGLSQRQLTMIAIGGVIGAGFFVGSGVVIRTAAPPHLSPTPCAAC